MRNVEPLGPSERTSLERLDGGREPTRRHRDPACAGETAVYVEGLLRRPGMDQTQEAELVARAQAGDLRAKEVLVEAMLPRVLTLARRFRRSGVDVADLVQEGYLAVFDALRQFDPGRGTPFWAYAGSWVQGSMYRLVQDSVRALRLPSRALTDLGRLKRAAVELGDRDGGEVPLSLAAERCGLDIDRAEALVAAGRPVRSLDEPASNFEGAESLVDRIPDPTSEAAYDAVVEQASRPELRRLLGSLSARERDVLARRHGICCEPETLEVIAHDLGITRERVRQIESRAVSKLRAAAGDS
jgi:RNA polymerase sigma factor (sigma-70 family)